ncbi:MAG: hypothetical protein ACOX6T_26805 [Myxococcales bacterium]
MALQILDLRRGQVRGDDEVEGAGGEQPGRLVEPRDHAERAPGERVELSGRPLRLRARLDEQHPPRTGQRLGQRQPRPARRAAAQGFDGALQRENRPHGQLTRVRRDRGQRGVEPLERHEQAQLASRPVVHQREDAVRALDLLAEHRRRRRFDGVGAIRSRWLVLSDSL